MVFQNFQYEVLLELIFYEFSTQNLNIKINKNKYKMEIEDQDILIHSLKALRLIRDSINNSMVNLSNTDKITPFYIIPITAFLKKNQNFKIIYPKDNFKLSYLDTIKFPETTCALNISKMSYIPLFEIKKELGNNEENGTILDLIEKIIVENFDLKENIQILMCIFNELICNIQQHSESDFNCIQAQIYTNKLAISLIDTGISIPSKYKKSGYKNEENNIELFKLAFKGISTKDNNERGTGIPNIYNWICDGLNGSMVIISKNCAFKKIFNEKIEFIDLEPLKLSFDGTIINLLFEKPKKKIDCYMFINKPLCNL